MKALALAIALVCSLFASAQTAPNKYWVQFSDKNDSPYTIEQPLAFLSEAALERRERFGIAVTPEDLPVNPQYIEAVLALGDIEYFHQSRWFNAITIKTLNPDRIAEIEALPFVAQTRSVEARRPETNPLPIERNSSFQPIDSSRYGLAYKQIARLNGHHLHAAGYTGHGVRIAVMDAGFNNVDELAAFERIRSENRLVQSVDFVSGGSFVAQGSNHGTAVLGCMAGELSGLYGGTAPDASYFLYRTEDAGSEFIIEEDNWIAAIEHADAAGIEVVNSSLGYSNYDNEAQSHTPVDMDGQTARISIAATKAAERGILVVTSAGNSGTSEWRIITAPADAQGILTVGAVDSLGVHAPFSSYGPAADGRVKPDVVAQGRAAAVINQDGGVSRSNGTSFSSPITCGLVACLRQAHPNAPVQDVLEAIRASASLYTAPNDSMGYGIPDFWLAHLILRSSDPAGENSALLYPNPASDRVYVEWRTEMSADARAEYVLRDRNGKLLDAGYLQGLDGKVLGNFSVPTGLANGLYLVELRWGEQLAVERLMVNR